MLPKFQIFFGVLEIPGVLGDGEKKEEYPPPPCLGIGIGERYGEEFLELWVYYPLNG